MDSPAARVGAATPEPPPMELPPTLSRILSLPSSSPERPSALRLRPPLPQPPTQQQRRALDEVPIGIVGLLTLDEASVNAFEEVAVTFFCANDWLGTKVVVSVAALLVCVCLCVKRMCRGRGKVSFRDGDEYEDDEEPVDDDLWERGMARQVRRVTRDPPRRGRRATRSLHEAAPPAPRVDPRSSPVPRSSPRSPPVPHPSPVAKPSPQRGEVIAKPVLDLANWTTQQVMRADQAVKESTAGKAVNKAVESTAQQVKDSHAGKAVGWTTQQVKESSAGQAVNKAFDFVGELIEPFPEATQAYLEPDSNMPAPPPAYWRRAPPDSPSASRRAARENAKVRPPSAPKELI